MRYNLLLTFDKTFAKSAIIFSRLWVSLKSFSTYGSLAHNTRIAKPGPG